MLWDTGGYRPMLTRWRRERAIAAGAPSSAYPVPVVPGNHQHEAALRVEKISKHFGGIEALASVSFEVKRHEVVALVGDNGAGKSTLVKIISGVLTADTGELFVNGERVSIRSPSEATALGIHTVYQDLALANNLDATENLFLGQEPVRTLGPLRWVDFGSMTQRSKELLASLGIATIHDLRVPVAQLSGGQRQTVAMARAMLADSAALLLDEPTAALGVQESRHVLDLILRLREHGAAVVVVSHNIQDVFEVADRIVVLRLGRVGAILRRAETTPEKVVGAIMGVA